MNGSRLNRKLNETLQNVSGFEKNFLRGLSLFVAVLSITLVTYHYVETYKLLKSMAEDPSIGITLDHTTFWTRLRIAVALAVNLTVVWHFTLKSFWIGFLAQLWVEAECLHWYLLSVKSNLDAGVDRLPEPNTLGLFGASWGDITVFAVTGIILLWTIKLSISTLSSLAKGAINNSSGASSASP